MYLFSSRAARNRKRAIKRNRKNEQSVITRFFTLIVMIKTSKKRDVWIWSVFVLLGLLLFANGIFNAVPINGFDSRFWAYVFLSACAVFSCYFADTKKSKYLIYSCAAILQSMLIADLNFEDVVIQSCICALSIGLSVFLLIKYRNAKATKIVEKKRLTEPVFSQINKFNLFANMVCIVGLLALLFVISENVIFRIAVVFGICLISLTLTYIKQRYKRTAFNRSLNIREYIFVTFWLVAALINAIILRDTRQDLGYVALIIIVLMTDYFIFDRPLVIEKLLCLSEQS